MRLRPVAVVRRTGRAIRRRLQRHALVLLYHRVARSEIDPWRLCVSPEHFSEHMDVLTRSASTVRLRDLPDRMSEGRRTAPPVAVTFDDGYADNLYAALPALARRDVPATVFVATSWIGRTEPFWWDVLADLIFSGEQRPADLHLSLSGEAVPFRSGTFEDRSILHRALWNRLRLLEEPERREVLEQLKSSIGRSAGVDPMARPLSVTELRFLHESKLVEIGAHSRSHRALTTLPSHSRWAEIDGSMKDCEQLLGRAPCSFAYPHGDYDLPTAQLVRKAGFQRALAATPGLLWASSNPFRIARVSVPNVDGERFEKLLHSEWLP